MGYKGAAPPFEVCVPSASVIHPNDLPLSHASTYPPYCIVQDTPGYGDQLDLNASIRTTLAFVEAQNVKWLEMEQSKQRKEDMAEMEDPRIDLCLFCIGPHR